MWGTLPVCRPPTERINAQLPSLSSAQTKKPPTKDRDWQQVEGERENSCGNKGKREILSFTFDSASFKLVPVISSHTCFLDSHCLHTWASEREDDRSHSSKLVKIRSILKTNKSCKSTMHYWWCMQSVVTSLVENHTIETSAVKNRIWLTGDTHNLLLSSRTSPVFLTSSHLLSPFSRGTVCAVKKCEARGRCPLFSREEDGERDYKLGQRVWRRWR